MATPVTVNFEASTLAEIDEARTRVGWTREQWVAYWPWLAAVSYNGGASHYSHQGISITNPKPADVALLKRYGAWVRAGFEEGWALSDLAAFVVEARRQGLKILVCGQPSKPRYVNWNGARYAVFGEWCKKVADLGIDAFEAGNELNNKPDFMDGDISTAAKLSDIAYFTAKAAYDAFLTWHPDLPIITNGWSPKNDGNAYLYPQVALSNMLSLHLDLAAKVDGYGYHPYEMSISPLSNPTLLPGNTPGWNPTYYLTAAWNAAVTYGASKPIWLTEFGYHGTDANQVAWMNDYYAAFKAKRAAGVNMGPIFWHTLYEGDSTVDPVEFTMGLLRKVGTQWVEKPAAIRMRELAATDW